LASVRRRRSGGISERIFPEWAASFQDRTARLTPVPLRTVMLGNAPQTLGLFGAAVGLVFLIAIANVASLMLVRGTARRREVALRTVLGATRMRLLSLMLTESLLLAAAGALAGILVAAFVLELLTAIGPPVPRLNEARLDMRGIGFALGVALLGGIVVGATSIAPLIRREPAPALRDGERTVGAGHATQRLRAALVVAEFALALPLLAGAGLLLNSFLRLQRVDPGFDPRRLVSVNVSLPTARYADDADVDAFWVRALARVREVSGVGHAGLGDALPPYDPAGNYNINNFDLVDRPVPPGGGQPTSPWLTVNADYFAALGVPLLEGRLFTAVDTAGAPPVVVVSRTWARRYFPDGEAVGRQLVSGGCTECPLTTIVGVVGDVKYMGLGGAADAVYDPLTAGWPRDLKLVVRAAAPPEALIDGVLEALRSVDPGVALDDAAPMEDRLYESIAQPRHWTALLGGFAAAAVTLAAVGIFGMLSYTVSTRRREIGVRMALGARGSAVVGMIVRRGMGHALVGAALGLTVALFGTRWLAGTLYAVSATDPPTLAAVTMLLLSVSFVACWLPARRAAAVNPVEAIRME
jgi:putative ABC transport system permease protein